jgi:hypothetical protein
MDGEIEINGIHYNYVKYRMYEDSVEYLCIPNQAKTKLSNARDEFYKLVNDLQHPSQNKKPGSSETNIKSFLSEFCKEQDNWSFPAFVQDQSIKGSFYLAELSKPALLPQELPPDA